MLYSVPHRSHQRGGGDKPERAESEGAMKQQINIGCNGDWVCEGALENGKLVAPIAELARAALEKAIRDGGISLENRGQASATVATGPGGEDERWTAYFAA